MAEAFDLPDRATQVFLALLQMENADEHGEEETLRKLKLARKNLEVASMNISGEANLLFLSLDVFAAFGRFKGRANADGLATVFPHVTSQALAACLVLLEQEGLVQKKEAGFYEVSRAQVLFSSPKNPDLAIEFIRLGMREADQAIDRWFVHSSSLFTSQVVSVRKKDLAGFFASLRNTVSECLNEFEADDGDALIRFNTQVYPCHTDSETFAPRDVFACHGNKS